MVDFSPEFKSKARIPTPLNPSSQGSQFSPAPGGADMIETVSGDVPVSQAASEASSAQMDAKFDEDSEDTSAKEEERFSVALNEEPPTWMSAPGFPADGLGDAQPPKSPRATSAEDPAEALTKLLGSRNKEEAAAAAHHDGACISRDHSADDKHPTETPSPKYRGGKRPSRSELAAITGQLTGVDDDLAPGHLLGDDDVPKGGSPDQGTLLASSRHTPPGISVGAGLYYLYIHAHNPTAWDY